MPEARANHDRILDIVVEKDEVTWQSMIYELVRHEGMNPWDIDVRLLAKRYLQMLSKLKELDFRISGKIVLAAAILLKIKSQKLLSDDISELDRLMNPEEEMSEDDFYEDLDRAPAGGEETPALIPRTPQPRKRKVSIYDLMIALQKALEVRDRRFLRSIPSVRVEVPERKVDISKLISDVRNKILMLLSAAGGALTFSILTKDDERLAKIHKFTALLHLANVDHREIDLLQDEHFGEIRIVRADPSAAKKVEG
ncbi:segregation/condensation protein A [Candidatus Woesearchaeota archaeon]|nr:segregation/condensation protein A [Candidatus Woesearchaeota archaeon]